MAETCKVFQIDKAPGRITLLGDVAHPESSQHVIEFPGGAIEVTRLQGGSYWAHIHVNRREIVEDADGFVSSFGEVIDGRISRVMGKRPGVYDLEIPETIEQVAVLIRPVPNV